jgi:hypothetical protein
VMQVTVRGALGATPSFARTSRGVTFWPPAA